MDDVNEISKLIKKELGWVNCIGSVEKNLNAILPIVSKYYNVSLLSAIREKCEKEISDVDKNTPLTAILYRKGFAKEILNMFKKE